MVQIVREPGFGELLGQNFSQGLNTGIQQLMQQKISNLNQQKQQQNLQQRLQQGLSGIFSPEEAQLLSSLDPELLKPLIQEKARSQRQLTQTGPGIQTIAPNLSPDQAAKIGSLPPGVQQLWYRNYLESPQQALDSINKAPNVFSPKQIKDFAQENKNQLVELEKKPKQVIKEIQQPEIKKIEPEFFEKPKNVSDYMKEGLTKSEAITNVKEDHKRRHSDEKESQKFVSEVLKEEKAAKENNLTLDKMENLIKKGNLPPAALYKLVKDLQEKVPSHYGAGAGAAVGHLVGGPTGAAIGGGLGALVNPVASLVESGLKFAFPDTEQFEKLTTSFIRGAKAIFGNRVTDQDLKVFLQSIPNLSQTDNGKKQIIDNLKVFNKAAEVRGKVLKDILKKTNGKKPANLAVLVDQFAQKELDKLSAHFLSNQESKQEVNNSQPIQFPWQQINELGEI